MLLPFALTLAYGSLQCPRRSRSYLLLRRPSNERLAISRRCLPVLAIVYAVALGLTGSSPLLASVPAVGY